MWLSRGDSKQLTNDQAAIVVETNRDMYVGRLDLKVSGGNVVDFKWEAIPTTIKDTNEDEDQDMKNLSHGLKPRS